MEAGSPRNSSFWWQAILAALIGIGIGLMLHRFMHHQFIAAGSVHKQTLASQASTAINSALSQVKMPTLEQRMNILLMGVDSNGIGTQRFTNCRSDSMILVSCDPNTQRVGIVSIPRDSRVHIEGHGMDKINAAHAFGGPQLAVDTVKDVFGVPVDHYIVVDAQGLRKLFQVLGPLPVVVEKKMRYTDHAAHLRVALDPGLQVLTPEQCEEYVRFRHDARGDIGRIERQQWFLRQLSNKLKDPQVLLKLPDLYKLANDYVITDLSVEEMARLATFGKDIKTSQVETATLPGEAVTIRGGSYWSPDYTADAVVFNRLSGAPIGVAQENPALGSANSAIAAENDDGAKPFTVILKYPKGFDETALAYEKALTADGYKVKYRIKSELADCRHEEIVQTSMRADDIVTEQLQNRCTELKSLPISVNLDNHAPSDFVIILSPNSVAPPAPAPQEKEKES